MTYYHDQITQKSFTELKQLRKIVDFTLIGGWAVYFYANTLKSKDIDIIIDYHQLPLLAHRYQTIKNDRLHKYESRREEIQIDLYLPHYSSLGIPVEHLIHETKLVEGFTVLDVNYLYVLKLYTYSQREHSVKGRKDFLDLLSLNLSKTLNLTQVKKIINHYHLETAWATFYSTITSTSQVSELKLNQYQMSKLKATLE